jgi:hypothetical protein
MYLNRIPKHQVSFMKPYYHKREEPEGFCINTFKGYLAGTHDIRIGGYLGEYDFETECYLSITASEKSKEKFRRIINHTYILKAAAEEMEYFELLGNINTILKHIEKVVDRCNNEYVDSQVDNLLVEVGIKQPKNIF